MARMKKQMGLGSGILIGLALGLGIAWATGDDFTVNSPNAAFTVNQFTVDLGAAAGEGEGEQIGPMSGILAGAPGTDTLPNDYHIISSTQGLNYVGGPSGNLLVGTSTDDDSTTHCLGATLLGTDPTADDYCRAIVQVAHTGGGLADETHDTGPMATVAVTTVGGEPQAALHLEGTADGSAGRVTLANSAGSGLIVTPSGDVVISLGGINASSNSQNMQQNSSSSTTMSRMSTTSSTTESSTYSGATVPATTDNLTQTIDTMRATIAAQSQAIRALHQSIRTAVASPATATPQN